MKTRHFKFYILGILLVTVCVSGTAYDHSQKNGKTTSRSSFYPSQWGDAFTVGTINQETDLLVRQVPLGDPFIMLWNNKYYAYGTQSPDGIVVYVSDDLLTWSTPAGLPGGLALNREDVWADRNFWAPEVYHINGKFYMYYSADEHICVATADSPLGRFTQEMQKPIIEGEKCIDNSLFIDDDESPIFSLTVSTTDSTSGLQNWRII